MRILVDEGGWKAILVTKIIMMKQMRENGIASRNLDNQKIVKRKDYTRCSGSKFVKVE